MEGSNTTATAAAAATATQTSTKTYTERFQDMEQTINRIAYVVNFQTKALEGLMERVEALVTDFKVVRSSLNALIRLQEDGTPVNFDNLAIKMAKIEQEVLKKQVENSKAKGLLVATDTVASLNDVVEFTASPDLDYGVSDGNSLPEAIKTQLIGKKVGDVVETITISAIYVQVAPKTPGADTNETAAKSEPAVQH